MVCTQFIVVCIVKHFDNIIIPIYLFRYSRSQNLWAIFTFIPDIYTRAIFLLEEFSGVFLSYNISSIYGNVIPTHPIFFVFVALSSSSAPDIWNDL